MEPKFQSSFIPKGPVASTVSGASMGRGVNTEKSLFYFLSLIIFIVSVLLSLGTFGFKYYLKYSIDQMGTDLENARAALQSEVIRDLTRLDNRIISSKELITQHQILSPLFEFLEVSTPKSVQLTEFGFSRASKGLELVMKGEARGYSALAFLADILNKSQYFKDAVFYDLRLNARGDVNFSFKTVLDPILVSYQKEVERTGASLIIPTESTETDTSSTSSSLITPN